MRDQLKAHIAAVLEGIRHLKEQAEDLIVIAQDAFSEVPMDPEMRRYVKASGRVNQMLAKEADVVVEVKFGLPLVLKGVLTPEMARKALAHGVAAIQVSNHGGRQLDGVSAAIDALPGVADVVKGKVPIIMDSGIRRGTDVFKALSLGANAVAIGRPVLYGLSLGGWMGVKSVYDRLQAELTRDMLIAGIGSVKEFRRDYVMRAPGIAAS